MTLKAIETRYNGYRFRSRLEARWAVFFDTVGLPYDYEAEGFDLGDGLWYLPDFRLPRLSCPGGREREFYVEVKPRKQLDEGDAGKILLFARESQRDVLVLFGSPGPAARIVWVSYVGDDKWYAGDAAFVDMGGYPGVLLEALLQAFGGLRCDCSWWLHSAYAAARGARFDGERRWRQ